jgi:hypothetical protein
VHVSAVQLKPLPIRMPALGWAAVPLPTKTATNSSRSWPGCHAPIADALGAASGNDAVLAASRLERVLLLPAADFAAVDALPPSRRVYANSAHAHGAAAGTLFGPLPEPSRDSKLVSGLGAAAGATVIAAASGPLTANGVALRDCDAETAGGKRCSEICGGLPPFALAVDEEDAD